MVDVRPAVQTGDYVRTAGGHTRIRCRAYRCPPPFGGRSHTPIDPGTCLGPVACFQNSPDFVTIEVRRYWVNIWRAHYHGSKHGQSFAKIIDASEVQKWEEEGWDHITAARS